jgi:hypothetical protein
MRYRCVATSLEGFVQQLAVCYVGRGYWHYVTGRVPAGKDAAAIDAKLVEKYGISVPKWTRSRRRRQGRAGMQYLRFDDFFILLATAGEHRFFAEEGRNIKDARLVPIVYGGYSVGIRGGRVHVRMSDRAYADLRAYFQDIAVHRSVEELVGEFYGAPFEPYGPVKSQMFSILGLVNGVRKHAGLKPVPKSAVWLKRRYVRPFDPMASARL